MLGNLEFVDLYGEKGSFWHQTFLYCEPLTQRSEQHEWKIHPHRHQHITQIFVLTEGGVDVQFDDEHHRITAPALLYIPDGVMHGFDWQSHSQGTVLSVASPMLRQVEQNIGESVEAQLHLDGKALDVTYGIAAQSDILTTVGLRDNGETLGGYALSNLTAKLSDDAWSLTFYVDNLFDKYAFVSTRGRSDYITDANNRPDLQRGYSHYLLKPRTVGLKFDYNFGL